MKKTSAKWYEEINNFLKTKNKEFIFVIYDPDGWDRRNYEFSFNEEEITKEEFMKRTFSSTTMLNCGHDVIGEWEKI